jgi:tellurite resistance protein TehA-like permease
MGTGVVSILLHTLSTLYPHYYTSLHILSITFFILNTLLFALILLISILRYTMYPATWPSCSATPCNPYSSALYPSASQRS